MQIIARYRNILHECKSDFTWGKMAQSKQIDWISMPHENVWKNEKAYNIVIMHEYSRTAQWKWCKYSACIAAAAATPLYIKHARDDD